LEEEEDEELIRMVELADCLCERHNLFYALHADTVDVINGR
jgi:hypothetical protein